MNSVRCTAFTTIIRSYIDAKLCASANADVFGRVTSVADSFKQKLKLIVEYDIFDMNEEIKWVYGMDSVAEPLFGREQNLFSHIVGELRSKYRSHPPSCVSLVELKNRPLQRTATIYECKCETRILTILQAPSRHTNC